MEKIKVVLVSTFRDGGSQIYEDELNRLYYTYNYHKNKKVYNGFLYGSGPRPKEIPVELEIVNSFI